MTPASTSDLATGPLWLKTFGTVELRGPDRATMVMGATQSRPLALLAYLAVDDGGRFHRRDLVTAMFWPESEAERSRHALRQTLYALRQAAGAGLVESRGQEEIGVGSDALTCDAVEFSALLDSGQPEQALALYQGDFLAGLHVAGASSEFEDWLTGWRLQLRRRAVAAAVNLAAAAEANGTLDVAQRWLRFAIDTDPLAESSYRSLIRVRMSARESGAARDLYQTLAERLKRDLDREPSADIRALLDQRPAAAPPLESPATPADPARAPDAAAPTTTSRSTTRQRWLIAAAIAVLIGGVTLLPAWWRRPQPPPLIAVAGFGSSTKGDSSSGAIMADLLANGLARLPGLQVVSGPRLLELEEHLGPLPASVRPLRAASAGGATLLVRGQLSGTEGNRRIDLELIEVGSGRIRHSARASAPDLLSLADSAAGNLAAWFRAPLPEQPLSVAATRSLTAYRFYEEGLRSYYLGDGSAALRLFEEALAEDSNFAMAAYYGAEAAHRQSDGAAADRMQERMRQLAPSLPDRERLLLLTSGAMAEVDPRATTLADSLVVRWPGDPDAELLRSRAYYMFGNQTETMASARRAIELDSANVRRDIVPCRACDAFVQLALAQIAIDDLAAAERTARQFLTLQPHLASAHALWSGILLRIGNIGGATRETEIADSLAGRYPAPNMEALLRSGEFATADAELERRIQSSIPFVRQDGRWWLTISLRTQGRLLEAIRLQRNGVLQGGRAVTVGGGSDTVQLAQLLCESGAGRQGAAMYASMAQSRDPSAGPHQFHQARQTSWVLTHSATCLAMAGDTGSLAALANRIEAVAVPTGSPRHLALPHYVRGLLFAARNDWSGAVAEQEKAMTSPVEGLTRINYELAGALLNLHRPAEAIQPLQAALRGPLDAGGLYVTRTELEARLAEAFSAAGQRDSAAVHEAWVEQAWKEADPAFLARHGNGRRSGHTSS